MKLNIQRFLLPLKILMMIIAFSLVYIFWVIVTPDIQDEVINQEAYSNEIETEEVAEETEKLMLNENAIVKKKQIIENSDGELCQVVVEIEALDLEVSLNVSELEYIIINKKDQIKVNYVIKSQTKSLEMIQWARTHEGKLQFDDDRPIVILDAGHGGYDSGEGSNDLWIEKELNLKMTWRMKRLLEEEGIRVVLTRRNGDYVSLYERCEIANYMAGEMFISNHINKFDGERRGVEVLYSSLADESFANDLANGISNEELPISQVYNRRSNIFPQRDYYFIHKYMDCPSYIIEYGYADNEEDTMYISENWEAMIEDTVKVITNYIRN